MHERNVRIVLFNERETSFDLLPLHIENGSIQILIELLKTDFQSELEEDLLHTLPKVLLAIKSLFFPIVGH